MAGAVSSPTPGDAEHIAERLTALEGRLSHVRHLVDDLTEQRDAAAARATSLESDLAASLANASRLEREKAQALARAERAAAEVAEATALATESRSLPAVERAELERQVAAAQKDSAIYQEMVADALNDLDETRSELAVERERTAAKQAELDILNARVDQEIDRLTRRSDIPARGKDMLQRLWPRLVLHPDARAFIEDTRKSPELAELGGVLTDLQRRTLLGTKFKGTKNVWEVSKVRIEKQGSNAGRVYYRQLSDGRLWVLIERKDPKRQDALGQWFDKLPEPDDDY